MIESSQARSWHITMQPIRIAAWLIAALLTTFPAQARTPPSRMMANVYLLTEASSVLDICFDSAAFKSLPDDKATKLKSLSARLGDLIRSVAIHYKDDSLYATYESTKSRISADPQLRSQTESKYQSCGDRLLTQMEAYVVENEALLNGYFTRQAEKKKNR
jgi:hypothetical protein